jgi:DNA polymerase-3 subunit delta'
MNPLYGHGSAVAAFRDALDSGRLHHAWLISGPEGVGKACSPTRPPCESSLKGRGASTPPASTCPPAILPPISPRRAATRT